MRMFVFCANATKVDSHLSIDGPFEFQLRGSVRTAKVNLHTYENRQEWRPGLACGACNTDKS
jgi:hypothetical protein